MPRKNLPDYTGPKSRFEPERLASLGPSWVLQPKLDGAYCHLELDHRGRVARAVSRTGADFSRELVGDLLGASLGAPRAVLVGELTAHTECGRRQARELGYVRCTLFDCVRGPGGHRLAHLPYSARRDVLQRMHARAELDEGPNTHWEDAGVYGARDKPTGKFCRAVPEDWRMAPVIEQFRPSRAPELWDRVQTGELEGVVAVNLAAPVGKRGAKAKCKITTELDAVVASVDKSTAVLTWAGGSFCVNRAGRQLEIGDVVEVAHDGWYETGATPRFARIRRVRSDLVLH